MAPRQPLDLRLADNDAVRRCHPRRRAGSRLKARTGPLPKPMVPLLGSPLLEHQFALCRTHGFTRILLLVHHAHEAIRAHFGDGSRVRRLVWATRSKRRLEEPPARCTTRCRSLLDTFLVLYGDTYLDVDLRRHADMHAASDGRRHAVRAPERPPAGFRPRRARRHGFVTALHPYPHPEERDNDNLANAALFVMQQHADSKGWRPETHRPTSRSTPSLPMLQAGRRLFGYVSPEYIKDVGTPERLDRVRADISGGMPERLSGRTLRSAVFLDRDGTLNREVHHLDSARAAGAARRALPTRVRRINRSGPPRGCRHQSGCGRARRRHAGRARSAFIRRLKHAARRHGAYVDAIYVCPHHPDRRISRRGPRAEDRVRVPQARTGLIDAACRDLAIDRRTSWMVGDTTSDIETGRRAGLRTILVRTGYAGQDGKYLFRPDYVVTDLAAAVAWILDGHPPIPRRMAPIAAAALDARLLLIGGLARSGKSFVAQVLQGEPCRRSAAPRMCCPRLMAEAAGRKSRRKRCEGPVRRRPADDRDQPLLGSDSSPFAGAADLRPGTARHVRPLRCELSIGPDDLIIVEGVPALTHRRPCRARQVFASTWRCRRRNGLHACARTTAGGARAMPRSMR